MNHEKELLAQRIVNALDEARYNDKPLIVVPYPESLMPVLDLDVAKTIVLNVILKEAKP